MKLKSAPANKLHDRHERALARLAMRAALDAHYGGAKALVILRRLENSPNYRDYAAAVDASYHSSNPPTPEYTPTECPECGQVYLGQDAARACCAELDEAYECQECGRIHGNPDSAEECCDADN